MLTETHEQVKLTPLENPDFIVEPGLLAKTGLMVIAGEPAAGKSWLAMQAAFDIAHGNRLWGIFPTKKSRTLFFELENRTVNERQRFISFDHGYSEDVGYCDKIEPSLDNEQFKLFRQEIKEWGAEVCVIDSYTATIDDENDLKSQKRTLKWYRKTASELSVAIILVQQLNKRSRTFDNKTKKYVIPPIALDDIRGSKVFEYGIDTAVGLNKTSHEYKELHFLKTRYCEYPLVDTIIRTTFDSKQEHKYFPTHGAITGILNILDSEGTSALDYIQQKLNMSRPTLLEAIEQLKVLGVVRECIESYPQKIIEAINLAHNGRYPKLDHSDFTPLEIMP